MPIKRARLESGNSPVKPSNQRRSPAASSSRQIQPPAAALTPDARTLQSGSTISEDAHTTRFLPYPQHSPHQPRYLLRPARFDKPLQALSDYSSESDADDLPDGSTYRQSDARYNLHHGDHMHGLYVGRNARLTLIPPSFSVRVPKPIRLTAEWQVKGILSL